MENGRSRGSGQASEWTGEKRTKIQSTPSTPGDLGNTVRMHYSGGQEQIEGLDRDNDRLQREFISLFERLNGGPPAPQDDDDDESPAWCDAQQLKALNQRLALCRIRAHEEKYRGMDDASLLALFPPSNLEDNWYYNKYYQRDFQWDFDPDYCKYVHLQDYQRLMLPDNVGNKHLDPCN
ncbi:uncharacterized protein [Aegilops tauschii subsp. strangulata]|uniref:uncharacterized protein n=1 Tax=Aegilops tauschii subsp. strangulata TaxID=200361 RepID=UPI001E1C9E4E|nr:uncharacterized protein LOC109742873 [Aegilops tauschii subsp. strangulata]